MEGVGRWIGTLDKPMELNWWKSHGELEPFSWTIFDSFGEFHGELEIVHGETSDSVHVIGPRCMGDSLDSCHPSVEGVTPGLSVYQDEEATSYECIIHYEDDTPKKVLDFE